MPSAKRAGAVTMVGQIAKIAVQFCSLVAFSHLLSPRDVGLFAMVAVFLAFGELIRDFGISQAAIQTEKLTHGQGSNLFWSNAVVGVALTLTLVLAAPAVAGMYNEPALRDVAPWVAMSFTINALQAQFQVRLVRDLRFVALTVTDTASQVIGLVAGLIAALAGASYWSLVIQMLSIYGSLLMQRALIARWWPGRPRRETGMGALYLFSVHSGLSQLMSYIAFNVDTYLIGIRWGAGPLGIYSRAFQMFTVPANQLLAPLTNVALPLLSRQRHDGEDFYPLLWKAQVAMAGAITLIFALVAALSEPIVRLALGEAWIESATILPILAVGGAAQVLSYVNLWAFLASGKTKQLFYSSLVTRPLLVACIVCGSIFGLPGIAWGFSAGLCFSWLISLVWLNQCDAMPIWQFMGGALHILSAGLVAGGVGLLIVSAMSSRLPTAAVLAGGALLVSAIYVPMLFVHAATRRIFVDAIKSANRKAKQRFVRT